jgi:pseudouridine kinase
MKNKETIYVIGGANIDCVGFPLQSLNQKDSNPAIITTSFGGVARNIVDNLTLFEKDVKFLTVFSNDGFGQDMEADLIRKGVDTSLCLHFNDPSPMYMAMLDQSLDLLMAMVDTRLLDNLSKEDIVAFLQDSTKNDVVVLDTNLDPCIIEVIIEHAKGKVVCDPISIEKGKKIHPYLSKLSLFKPNQFQAEILSGIKIVDEPSLVEVGSYFRKQNIAQTIITLGNQGGLFVDKSTMIRYRSNPRSIKNAVGAGDSFIAAFVAFESEYDKIEALKMSVAVAGLTCDCVETVNQSLTINKVKAYMKKNSIEIEVLEQLGE